MSRLHWLSLTILGAGLPLALAGSGEASPMFVGLPGGWTGGAFAVSADGSTIVGTGEPTALGMSGAFIWDATHGMRDLEQVLTGLGLDLTGWGLFSATGISADGRVIVGNGGQGAWLAVLPEPGSTVLLGVALVALVILRRRHRPA